MGKLLDTSSMEEQEGGGRIILNEIIGKSFVRLVTGSR